MSSLKKNYEKVHCPRCQIVMERLYQRTYGAIEFLYSCPKCKGIVQK